MLKKTISVAIDGPSGAGKSTMAKKLAAQLGFLYVDTGAIYRTVAVAAHRKGVQPEDAGAVAALLGELDIGLKYDEDGLQHMLLNGEDVTKEIRLPEVSMLTSRISALPAVRDFLLAQQRRLAQEHDVVMDGRDIGTVVLPQATVKIFLTASPEERARRRWAELESRGTPQPYDEVLADMRRRDENDRNRAVAPLKQAEDAVLVDTTALDPEESLERLAAAVKEKM